MHYSRTAPLESHLNVCIPLGFQGAEFENHGPTPRCLLVALRNQLPVGEQEECWGPRLHTAPPSPLLPASAPWRPWVHLLEGARWTTYPPPT